VEEYSSVFVFELMNSRTALLKQVRVQFRDAGRLVIGKTKFMQLGLGRTREEALKPNLDELGKKLGGASSTIGLFFTNMEPKETEARFAQVTGMDFARAGFKVSKTVELNAGPIVGQPSSMLEPLRALKLPVVLRKGIIELEQDHVACNAGDVLTVEQARVLKLFGVMMSEFRIKLLWRWTDGELVELEGGGDADMDDDDD
jgi:mRNA turnover protein 4